MTLRVLNYNYVTKRTDFVSVVTKLINISELKKNVKLFFLLLLGRQMSIFNKLTNTPSKKYRSCPFQHL